MDLNFSGNFFRLAFLLTCCATVGFSQQPIHVDVEGDIPSNGNWFLDCPSGYQELVERFNCRDSGRVDLPDEDYFGQKGFWTKCLDRCRITYYVQPGDSSFAARTYMRGGLPLEISYDGVSWDWEFGEGWIEIQRNLDPSITQISMQFDHLHEEIFVLLDRIAVNADLPPLDPTTSTTENAPTTIPATSTESQTTEVEPSSTISLETTLSTLGTSEATTDTTLGISETTIDTTLGTSETTLGTTTETTSDTPSESTLYTTIGSTPDITSETTLVTILETTYETTTLVTTAEPFSEGSSGATMDPNPPPETTSASTSTPRTTFVTETPPPSPHPPIGTQSTTPRPTPPTGETSSTPPRRTRSTTPAAGPPSSSKWADFFTGKWGILLLSFLGAIISTILILLCARCICMRYGVGTRRHRKKKSDLERILSRSDSSLNKHSEMPRNQNVSQVANTNPKILSPSALQDVSHQNPYPRAILRESTPYRDFNQRQQQDSVPIYEIP